jgi:hypothetical protein
MGVYIFNGVLPSSLSLLGSRNDEVQITANHPYYISGKPVDELIGYRKQSIYGFLQSTF